MFDSLIHLQDSQTRTVLINLNMSLIHLFTYKTLKLNLPNLARYFRLIHLFTYKTLKRSDCFLSLRQRLIHLFTYKTLKLC